VHFSQDLSEDYYKQLTAEYRTSRYKNGRKVSRWEKKQADRNEALDLMVYNLAAAYHLGLHKRTEGQWQRLREKLNPLNQDMFLRLEVEQGESEKVRQSLSVVINGEMKTLAIPDLGDRVGISNVTSGGRISLFGTRRGNL
jgi:phage terminase large subunit GpA-like protein